MYLPEPEFTYRLINPLPSFTIAALKPWKITELKIDLSLPKYQGILNIFFKPSKAINGNNCLDTFFSMKAFQENSIMCLKLTYSSPPQKS